MTEYMYLASDKPLALGSFGDSAIHTGRGRLYVTADFVSYYFEEEFFDLKLNLSDKNRYRVSSQDSSLPEEGTVKLNEKQNKAVSILYQYISNYFKEENPDSLTILFILNGHKVDHTLKKERIKFKNLKIENIYYSEQRLLEIVRK